VRIAATDVHVFLFAATESLRAWLDEFGLEFILDVHWPSL
jgi:hypothetical protein